jgi:hypothetical protein
MAAEMYTVLRKKNSEQRIVSILIIISNLMLQII